MKLDDHPTVRNLAKVQKPENRHAEKTLESAWLRRLALDRGAHDAGCVEIGRAALEPQLGEILRNYPWTKSLLSFVVRMAREPVRGAPRSVANLEIHEVIQRGFFVRRQAAFLLPRDQFGHAPLGLRGWPEINDRLRRCAGGDKIYDFQTKYDGAADCSNTFLW